MRRCLPSLIALSLALSLAPSSFSAARSPTPSARRSLEGRVLAAGGAGTVPGAVVLAIHLDSGKVFESTPAGASGEFSIVDLPYGYYEFAIQANGVLHATRGVLNLEPRQRKRLEFRLLAPGSASPDASDQAFGTLPIQGLDKPATGRAEIVGLYSPQPFLRSPAGIATIVGGSALLLLLLK